MFLHPANHPQNVNEQTISKGAPSFEKQANYIASLKKRGEKNDDAIANWGKAKCVKRRFKAKDE